MKSKRNLFVALILIVLLFITTRAHGQPWENTDRTLSPYFFLKSDDPGVDQLPLKSTSVDVKVSGVIADVIVT